MVPRAFVEGVAKCRASDQFAPHFFQHGDFFFGSLVICWQLLFCGGTYRYQRFHLWIFKCPPHMDSEPLQQFARWSHAIGYTCFVFVLCWHKLWCSHDGWGKSFVSSLLHCSFRPPKRSTKGLGGIIFYETLPESLTLRIAHKEDNVHLVRFQSVFNAPIARGEFEKPTWSWYIFVFAKCIVFPWGFSRFHSSLRSLKWRTPKGFPPEMARQTRKNASWAKAGWLSSRKF